jgi:Ulp1 family protease
MAFIKIDFNTLNPDTFVNDDIIGFWLLRMSKNECQGHPMSLSSPNISILNFFKIVVQRRYLNDLIIGIWMYFPKFPIIWMPIGH